MDKKLNFKQILVVASTLFGMIFGAGNLIFPVHMGQLAGSNFLIATSGFAITGVIMPILGIIAIGYSESNGLYSLASKISKPFAFIYTIIMYLAIGPCAVMPRSASIAYGAGLAAIIGDKFNQDIAFLIFSFVFFVIVLAFSLKPSGITTSVGKVINPVFLVFLFSLLIIALSNPMADPSQVTPTEAYQKDPFFCGFIQGYGTMDALAGLAFGIILIDIVKRMGVKTPGGITKSIMVPSVMTGCLMFAIYALTILMGVESRGAFDISSNGSVALSDVSNYYFGLAGNAVLTTIVTLGALKTSIGLVTSCSTTFCEIIPTKKIGYKTWAVLCVLAGFTISNLGLDNILSFSQPVLCFLCPLAIVLIILAFIGKRFDYSPVIFKTTIYITCIPALFDAICNLPADVIANLNLQDFIVQGQSAIPLADVGFGWLIPAIIGFGIGYTIYKISIKHRSEDE